MFRYVRGKIGVVPWIKQQMVSRTLYMENSQLVSRVQFITWVPPICPYFIHNLTQMGSRIFRILSTTSPRKSWVEYKDESPIELHIEAFKHLPSFAVNFEYGHADTFYKLAKLLLLYHSIMFGCRKLMGQDLSGLSIKDLQDLENQLEPSLKSVQMRKVKHISAVQTPQSSNITPPPHPIFRS